MNREELLSSLSHFDVVESKRKQVLRELKKSRILLKIINSIASCFNIFLREEEVSEEVLDKVIEYIKELESDEERIKFIKYHFFSMQDDVTLENIKESLNLLFKKSENIEKNTSQLFEVASYAAKGINYYGPNMVNDETKQINDSVSTHMLVMKKNNNNL